jgi:hypothetical protein
MSFIVSALIFMSLGHLKLTFINDIRYILHSFVCAYPVVLASFVEKTILSPMYYLGILSNSWWERPWVWPQILKRFFGRKLTVYVGFIFGMTTLFLLFYMSVLTPVPQWFFGRESSSPDLPSYVWQMKSCTYLSCTTLVFWYKYILCNDSYNQANFSHLT